MGARGRRSSRGTAIVPALVVVVIVATLSMIFLQLSLAKNKEQRSSVDAKRAFYMAEAGLAEGFNGLCIGKSGNVASKDLPAEFSNGLFWTTATENGQGRVTLESTGLCGAGRATLSMVVERRSDSVGGLGFFGDQAITVEAGAQIDSYDSRNGPYLAQALAVPVGGLLPTGARVGCNSDITVKGTATLPTVIYGDVRPGPAGTLFRSRSASISGSMAPFTAKCAFPEVKVPALTSAGEWVVSKPNTSLDRGAHGYDKLYVKSGASLRIVGPALIVAQELQVESRAQLVMDASAGPIKMYVVKDMKLDTGSVFSSASTDPLSIGIQVGGSTSSSGGPGPGVEIASSGDFYGSIYAPHSAVSVPAGLSVYGAVTAQALTIMAGGKLHYDRAMAAGASDSSGGPKLLGWHIVELPNVPVVNLRFDALRELKERGKTPELAKDAHIDIGVVPD